VSTLTQTDVREDTATSSVRGFVGTVLSVMLLGAVVLAAAALVVVPKLTGSVPLTVLTGSMSPTYDPGSVVVVRPTPVDELEIGDVITFQERSGDPTVVTHRIIGVGLGADGERQFTTQGDANDDADPEPVGAVQVRGEVWYAVPLAGYVATAIGSHTRELAINVVAGGLLVYGGYLMAAGAVARRRRGGVSPA
jgi:signal peptidase